MLDCDALAQEIMALFLQVFRRLDSPSAPAFQLCLSVLDTVSQVPEPITPRTASYAYCLKFRP